MSGPVIVTEVSVAVVERETASVVQVSGGVGPQGPPGPPGAAGLSEAELRSAPVAVSGTVAVSNHPTSIEVSNFPDASAGGLTNEQLRETAVQVGGSVAVSNFPGTQDVSVVNALDVHLQNPTADPETGLAKDATLRDGSTHVAIDNWPEPPAGDGLTDAELRAAPVAVTADWPQPFTGGLTNEELRADMITVGGTVTISNPTPATDLGADGASPPAISGTGVRGWLRGIYEKVSAVATAVAGTLTVGGTVTVANPTTTVAVSNQPTTIAVSNLPATQPVSGTVAVSNPTAQGVTDAQMRAAVLPTADRALVVGPFTGRDNAGNVLTSETIALPGLFGPDATPLQARYVQVVFANNCNQILPANSTRSLVLTETVAGRTVTRTIQPIGATAVAVNGVSVQTYALPGTSITLAVPRTATVNIPWTTAPTSGSVTVLAYAFAGAVDPLAVGANGYPQTALVDNNGNAIPNVNPNADTFASSQTLAVASLPYLQNGSVNANFDRQRNNASDQPLSSLSRTTEQITGPLINYNARAHKIFVNIAAYTAGGLVVKLQGKDPNATTYYDILTSAVLSGVGLTVLTVSESMPAVANLVAQDRLPRNWRIIVTPQDATPITYSVRTDSLV